MTPCFRLEIVVEGPRAAQMVDLLSRLNVPGYTQLPDVLGAGDRGRRNGDELTGDTSNCLFLVACHEREQAEKIIAACKPLLEKGGGICLLSEAEGIL